MEKVVLEKVIQKYNYDDNLTNALLYVLDAMVSVYGEDEFPSLIEILLNTPIYTAERITEEVSNSAREKEMAGLNSHIKVKEEINPYGNVTLPGSVYSCETIFDKDMNPVDHKKWIIVKDEKDHYNASGYVENFGTTINVPYLIHELNHAYAMQSPLIRVKDGKIYEKKGMFITITKFTKKGDFFELEDESSDDIILEEAINEALTLQMLCNKMGLQTRDQVREKLNSFHHVGSSYSPIIMYVADTLQNMFGDKLMSYRKDNDYTMYKEFNEVASNGEIARRYLEGKLPYQMLSEYTKKSYLLTCECYTHPIEEYKKLQYANSAELLAPIYAFYEGKGKSSLEEYEEMRLKYGVNLKEPSVR